MARARKSSRSPHTNLRQQGKREKKHSFKVVKVLSVVFVLALVFAFLYSHKLLHAAQDTSTPTPSSTSSSPSSSLFSSTSSPQKQNEEEKKEESHKLRITRTSTAKPPTSTHMQKATAATVVVIGGGLAGQSAAIEAARNGAQVILLEKEARLGGNSGKATSGINGWGTPAQKAQGIVDSGKYFERDTFLSGRGGHNQPGLVKMLSERSADAVNWLSSFGVPLTVLSQLGGASRKRCHRAPEKPDGTPLPIGFTIVKTLEQYLRNEMAASVQIETSATLTKLVSEPVRLPSGLEILQVKRVEYRKATKKEGAEQEEIENRQLDADSVILATGGFSNDHTSNSLLNEYAPNLSSFPTTNGPWATGDGVKLARELGVELVDMDKVQLHPTGLINPKDPNGKSVFLGPEALRGSGGILLNKRGERFINELDLRSVVSNAILQQEDIFPASNNRRFAHCVLNEEAATAFGKGTLGFYWKKMGLFSYAEDAKALAELIGCDEAKLRETLAQYEATSTANAPCPLTGKNVFPCVLGPQGPFYVAYVTPSIHYTMGGCLISPSAEIQSSKTTALGGRQSILGLFGAGEVTGGVHGGNRLGGNSLLECVVFGRIAGRRASQPAVPLASAALASPGAFVPVTVREIVTELDAEEQATTEGSRQLVLNLPHPLQVSGLALLQRLTLRHRGDGQTKTVEVRPCSLPSDVGSIAVHLPPSASSSQVAWLYDLLPGDEVEISAGEANSDAAPELPAATTALYVVAAAPSGVAVTLQLVRHALEDQSFAAQLTGGMHLLYAAENTSSLHYRKLIRACEKESAVLKCKMLVNTPPAKWEGGVGIIDEEELRNILPPVTEASQENVTIVVAGGATETSAVMRYLRAHRYNEKMNVLQLQE